MNTVEETTRLIENEPRIKESEIKNVISNDINNINSVTHLHDVTHAHNVITHS